MVAVATDGGLWCLVVHPDENEVIVRGDDDGENPCETETIEDRTNNNLPVDKPALQKVPLLVVAAGGGGGGGGGVMFQCSSNKF